MYLIEINGYIKGYSSKKPHADKCHEVEEDNEFYLFLKDHHPYKKVKVTAKGVMSYEEDLAKKKINNRAQFKKERSSSVGKLVVKYQGMVFDADEVSQNRLLRPIAILQNDTDKKMWVLSNNEVVYLTRPQFIAVLDLAYEKQSSIWIQE